MGLFDIFRSAPVKVAPDLSFIGVDMHSHLLPSLDDGSQDVEDSVNFIRDLHALGYHKFICTPHIISDMYPNSKATIDPAFALLTQRLKEEQIPVELSYAAEYMVNADFEDVMRSGSILSFGDKYVLVEMSYMAASPNIKDVIFDLIMKGYKPVLAHPERYSYYHGRFDAIESFIDAGCLLQINLLSLSGFYGKEVKRVCEMLIKERMVSFVGTDLHHERHLKMLKELASNGKIIDQLKSIDLKNASL